MNWVCLVGLIMLFGNIWLPSAQPVVISNRVFAGAAQWTNSVPRSLVVPKMNPAKPTTNWMAVLQVCKPSTSQPLKPGIYQTAPFSCIVVVPGPHLDDRAIVGAGPSVPETLRMPTVRPDLQFIPWSPRK